MTSDQTRKIPSIFRCPSCGRELPVPVDSEGEICSGCGFEAQVIEDVPLLVSDRAVIEKRIADAEEQGRDIWYREPQSKQFTGPYRHHMRKRHEYLEFVLREFKSRAPEHAVALDLGCGDGNNLALLGRHVPVLFACDYNLLRLARAGRKPGVSRVFMADVLNIPVVDDAFDLVLFNHVLEHIHEDGKALAEVRRILKPGGLLILGVPNEGAAFWRLAYALQPSAKVESDHVHFYTSEAIAAKCRAAGFTVDSMHHMGWGLPHWRLDSLVRGYKIVDDVLEKAGRAVMKSQATSLYLLLTK